MRTDPAKRLAELTKIDSEYWAASILVGGVDEVGRGPLAGPVAAGCVILPPSPLLEGIDDSKKVSEKKRELLYDRISEIALYAHVGWASVEEIEELNILGATRLAMQRAAAEAPCGIFLVDALEGLILPAPQRGIVHGDALSYSIAAASIFAKVERDRLMARLDEQYPQYGFAQNKGYGTAVHIAAIREYGPCPYHRRSFITKFTDGQP